MTGQPVKPEREDIHASERCQPIQSREHEERGRRSTSGCWPKGGVSMKKPNVSIDQARKGACRESCFTPSRRQALSLPKGWRIDTVPQASCSWSRASLKS